MKHLHVSLMTPDIQRAYQRVHELSLKHNWTPEEDADYQQAIALIQEDIATAQTDTEDTWQVAT
jgi:hypothetical protein